MKTRLRLKYGIGEHLLPLVKLRGIGRVRARLLYDRGIKDLKGVKAADPRLLVALLGPKIAANLKKHVGLTIQEVPKGKRKGQLGLRKYEG